MKPGDKVVCINSKHENEFKGLVFKNWIEEGKEYTIREILDNDGIVTSVLLDEVYNRIVFIPALGREQEPSFRIDRFRKVEMQPSKAIKFTYTYVN